MSKGPDLPYGSGSRAQEVYTVQPKIKLTHDDKEAWFGITCGPDWYVKIKTQLGISGFETYELTFDGRRAGKRPTH